MFMLLLLAAVLVGWRWLEWPLPWENQVPNVDVRGFLWGDFRLYLLVRPAGWRGGEIGVYRLPREPQELHATLQEYLGQFPGEALLIVGVNADGCAVPFPVNDKGWLKTIETFHELSMNQGRVYDAIKAMADADRNQPTEDY